MAHHGRSGKNKIPPGNMPGHVAATPEVVEEVADAVTQSRGRTAKTHPHGPQSTESYTPQVMQREVNRPQSAGVKKRGDRRDTSADPGTRGNGHNRSIRQSRSGGLTGKANIGGKRMSNNRSKS